MTSASLAKRTDAYRAARFRYLVLSGVGDPGAPAAQRDMYAAAAAILPRRARRMAPRQWADVLREDVTDGSDQLAAFYAAARVRRVPGRLAEEASRGQWSAVPAANGAITAAPVFAVLPVLLLIAVTILADLIAQSDADGDRDGRPPTMAEQCVIAARPVAPRAPSAADARPVTVT